MSKKRLFVICFVVLFIVVSVIYVYLNQKSNFEITGKLEINNSGKTWIDISCNFNSVWMDVNNISYAINVPNEQCELYKSLENKNVKIIGKLEVKNTGNQDRYSQIPSNVDRYIIYPKEIIKLEN